MLRPYESESSITRQSKIDETLASAASLLITCCYPHRVDWAASNIGLGEMPVSVRQEISSKDAGVGAT
jgi:hypothetical protein